jgi:hypothetical protein
MTSLLKTRERECDDMPYRSPHVRLGPWNSTHVARKACSSEVHLKPITNENKLAQFKALTRQWKRETAIVGQVSKIVMHPAYQRIMAMGPDVIPFILKDMSQTPGHWFWALHNLVPAGQDPAEGAATIKDATWAWLEWGKKEGIL